MSSSVGPEPSLAEQVRLLQDQVAAKDRLILEARDALDAAESLVAGVLDGSVHAAYRETTLHDACFRLRNVSSPLKFS